VRRGSGHTPSPSNLSLYLPRGTRIDPDSSSALPEYRGPFDKPVKQLRLDCKPHSGGLDGQPMEQCSTDGALFVTLGITSWLRSTMSEIAKILVTSSLTALAAVVVFVFSQLLGKLVIEPVQDLKKTLGEIRFALVFHAPAASTPVGDRASEDLAAEAFRKLACDLLSKLGVVPCYDTWSRFSRGFLPASKDALEASRQLIGLSNSVHGPNRWERNPARVAKILRLLGFESLDEEDTP